MLNDQQKDKFSSLKVELIDLNILACFFIRKINRMGYVIQNTGRHFLMEEFVALRYMENGMILHLTNLDDDSSTYSFRKLLKEVNSTTKDQAMIKKVKRKLDSFRMDVNSLKIKHRNIRIAHLNYVNDLGLDEFLNFDNYIKPLIRQANEIGDFVWGSKIEYQFKLGTHEGILNFRNMFENLKFNINGQREFI